MNDLRAGQAARLARTRERELERAQKNPTPVTMPATTSAVGVSFTPTYPFNMHALAEHGASGEPLVAILVRNPANAYDSNAIEIHVPALGNDAMIGHIPAPLAARMAPEMDAGGEFMASVSDIRIHPDHPDRPGMTVHLDRVPKEPA